MKCYIVGGGPSLKNFDWNLIRGKFVIGCNSAISLGAEICPVVVFGDFAWWDKIGREAAKSFKGEVVGCAVMFEDNPEPGLTIIHRNPNNQVSGPGLGTAGNTGSIAIHLAAKRGAKEIFLLGFDMKMTDRKPNWHDLRYEPGSDVDYSRFMRLFPAFATQLRTEYPDVQVTNVTDDSKLDCFPKVSLKEHFKC